MTFEIEYSNQALKFLKQADKILLKRIFKKLELLRDEPFIQGTKPIEGYNEKLFRIRVGDYRILYEVNYENRKIGVVKIDKRSKVYQA